MIALSLKLLTEYAGEAYFRLIYHAGKSEAQQFAGLSRCKASDSDVTKFAEIVALLRLNWDSAEGDGMDKGASGISQQGSDAEKLYRRCGFSGYDVRHILSRKS